jgi:exosortase
MAMILESAPLTMLVLEKPSQSRRADPASDSPRLDGRQWRTPEAGLMWGLLLLAFAGLFFRWFYVQHLISSSKFEDWGHAYFVPLISVYLIWRRRDVLSRIEPQAFWPGLAPFLLGIMAYFFCVVGIKNHMLQGFSIVLTIFGLVLLLTGPRAMRYLFLPIAYLAFGVTVSEIIMIKLTFPLQLIASQGAYVVLTVIGAMAGFSAEVGGNMITVITSAGEVPLNVAEACSGMRMVVAFFAMAGVAALVGCPFWWQRVVLILTAAPVAIVLNIGRVAVLGLLSIVNPDLAAGEAHTLIGTILLVPGLLLFLGVVWTLKQISPEASGAPS